MLLFIGHTGCLVYADDLDRFINGQIKFEDIQGDVHKGVPIQGAIIGALQDTLFYSKEEHDLYEKLCYAYVLYVLHDTSDCPSYALYALYLAAKEECSPHKLDWNDLLKRVKSESGMDEYEMMRGEDIYKDYKESGRSYVLPPDDDY